MCMWKKLYLHYSYLGSVLVVSAVREGLCVQAEVCCMEVSFTVKATVV